MKIRNVLQAAVFAASSVACVSASAALVSFQNFVGNYGVSTSGYGTSATSGTITADVPAGATVVGAYLYSAANRTNAIGGTFNGTSVAYSPLGVNNVMQAYRTDVTSSVKAVVDGGAGGTYSFSITETNSLVQDGEALVVVYSRPDLAFSTVGILDGFAASAGDSTSINFSQALDPSLAGFFAEMRLGINYSCCNQSSTVRVNNTVITTNAGNNDDGVGALADGQLITVGGSNDPFSPLLPSYANDHERYNLVPYITAGDTTIAINTLNPSGDDNIFLAVFHVAGEAGINAPPPSGVPEPGSVALLGLGLAAVAATRRRNL